MGESMMAMYHKFEEDRCGGNGVWRAEDVLPVVVGTHARWPQPTDWNNSVRVNAVHDSSCANGRRCVMAPRHTFFGGQAACASPSAL
eukprot:354556-Chlamydomonas_euryale.AAC.3